MLLSFFKDEFTNQPLYLSYLTKQFHHSQSLHKNALSSCKVSLFYQESASKLSLMPISRI